MQPLQLLVSVHQLVWLGSLDMLEHSMSFLLTSHSCTNYWTCCMWHLTRNIVMLSISHLVKPIVTVSCPLTSCVAQTHVVVIINYHLFMGHQGFQSYSSDPSSECCPLTNASVVSKLISLLDACYCFCNTQIKGLTDLLSLSFHATVAKCRVMHKR